MNSKDADHKRAVQALEEHGFLFQQRCLSEIRLASPRFRVESEEYPVTSGSEETVIDFVLSGPTGARFYFIFECKRANPNYISWLFAKPMETDPRVPRFLGTRLNVKKWSATEYRLFFETVELDLFMFEPKHHVAFGLEVSDGKISNRKTSKTEGIYEACQQALTGVGGLALEHNKSMYLQPSPTLPHYYIPIVITTARILLTEFRQDKVDIKTGNLDLEHAETKEADWVVFDFPVREALQVTKPEDMSGYCGFGPAEDYRRKFKIKSVAIVQSESVVRFISQLNTIGAS